jgi:copper(I)-binding protein
MLLHLKQPLKAGQTFPLNLTFKEAGTINVNVLIGTVGAMDDPAAAASK